MFEAERKALSHNFLKFSIFIEIKIENNVRENHHETFFLLLFRSVLLAIFYGCEKNENRHKRKNGRKEKYIEKE